jgi:hypothetical protein
VEGVNRIELRKIVGTDCIIFENWLLFFAFITTCHEKIKPSSLFLLFFITICLNGMYNNYYHLRSLYSSCLKNYIFFRPIPTNCPSYSLFEVNNYKAFFKTFSDIVKHISRSSGHSIQEFISGLFNNFNYLEKILFILGLYKMFFDSILYSITRYFR